MRKLSSLTAVGILLLALLHCGPAAAQSASPDQMTAARELVAAMRATDQFKAIFPVLMQQLKPGIVQGRPEVERDYDTMIPAMLEIFNARSGEIVESMAAIYARNFTVDEMQQVISFYADRPETARQASGNLSGERRGWKQIRPGGRG